MSISVLLVGMGLMMVAAFFLGRGRSLAVAGEQRLNSLPSFYGILTALWSILPGIALLGLWSIFDSNLIEYAALKHLPEALQGAPESELGLVMNQIYNIANDKYVGEAPVYMIEAANAIISMQKQSAWLQGVIVLAAMFIGAAVVWFAINPQMKARNRVESLFRVGLLACACIAILTTLGILLSVLFESLRFFQSVPITEFLFGTTWSPQGALRADQAASESSFGAVPLFAGTLLIAGIAMIIAVPTGLMAAIYLSEYAPQRFRSIVKPLLEVLAGVPTVVYGFFAALTVAPLIRDIAVSIGLNEYVNVTSESALAAGLVMGVMIIPFVSSLSDDVINAVPQSLRDGSFGLGATPSETIKQVVIPAALPGIVGGILLAVSRAIGETMIVVMAAGLAANLTANPLDSVTTVTVQIVTLLVGDQEFDSPKTLAAFALGLMLFITTLALNYVALHVVKKYREQYD
ncbi:phosphate ABC transporter permease subunit PstC [Agaribacterium haliotis]|uniref:phosphate ABC transporter permease subunit PstC n=1 Tax=Agaribacterium haliotis TaxID=2013869 RepID=UPI000BB54573|nr:phosphate ABC transporter permease subunit PstC [Agaribacterium haliotis]